MASTCNSYLKNVDAVQKNARKQKKEKVKASKQAGSGVQYHTDVTKWTQEAVTALASNTDKKTPNKPY